jgi:hypothetical protein
VRLKSGLGAGRSSHEAQDHEGQPARRSFLPDSARRLLALQEEVDVKDEWISGFRWGVVVSCTALIVLGLLRIVG